MKTLLVLVVVGSLLWAHDSRAQTPVTCEWIDDRSEVSRKAIYLGAVIGYLGGWTDAELALTKEYPVWPSQHRYAAFVVELEVICRARPQWELRKAVGNAVSNVRFGQLWREE